MRQCASESRASAVFGPADVVDPHEIKYTDQMKPFDTVEHAQRDFSMRHAGEAGPRVAVCFDGSKMSERAFEVALKFVRPAGSQREFLHGESLRAEGLRISCMPRGRRYQPIWTLPMASVNDVLSHATRSSSCVQRRHERGPEDYQPRRDARQEAESPGDVPICVPRGMRRPSAGLQPAAMCRSGAVISRLSIITSQKPPNCGVAECLMRLAEDLHLDILVVGAQGKSRDGRQSPSGQPVPTCMSTLARTLLRCAAPLAALQSSFLCVLHSCILPTRYA